MRIAYVTTYDAQDVGSWSGTGYYAADALSRAGLEVRRIGGLSDFSVRTSLPLRLRRRFYNGILRSRHGEYWPMYEPVALRHYAEQVERALPGVAADAVLSPGTIPIAYLKTTIPIAFWSDATFDSLLGFYPGFNNLHPRTIAVGHRYEQEAIRRARLIIYSSEWAAASALRTYGADPARVKVVPYGANVECSRTLDDIRAIARQKSSSTCSLLFIGQEWERKGGPAALQVAALLRERGIATELTIVGCKPPEGSVLPAGTRVFGYVSKRTKEGAECLNTLFAQAHFFLLPTRADCTPVVYNEANSFGLPVVSTDVGGIPTIIRDDINGWKFAASAPASAYADAIAAVFHDRPRYEELAASSFNEYETRLNWKVAGAAVRRFLEEM